MKLPGLNFFTKNKTIGLLEPSFFAIILIAEIFATAPVQAQTGYFITHTITGTAGSTKDTITNMASDTPPTGVTDSNNSNNTNTKITNITHPCVAILISTLKIKAFAY